MTKEEIEIFAKGARTWLDDDLHSPIQERFRLATEAVAFWEIAYQLAARNEEAVACSKMEARMLEIAEADRAFREKVSQRQEANLEQINKVMEMASHFGLAPKPAAEPSTDQSIDGIPRDANGKPIDL